ncbi:hypothetical protein LEQ04_09230 [Riemerella anatipestifer]|nr:hypothetical protein LEQ03_02055 [Riemerella anatipestifer]WPC14723.1 hypothetical protein LEQ04_09230 [Riemerella anatipestifer]
MNKLTLIFVLMITISCDPVRTLILKNDTQKSRNILVYGSFITQKEKQNSIITELQKRRKKKSVFYGIGAWNDVEIKKFSSNIDSDSVL